MTNKQRYEKMQQAEKLIREVEFSYQNGDEKRSMLYRFIVANFSWTGMLGAYIADLKAASEKEVKTEKEEEDEFLESIGLKP